ncbi:MAG: pantetheine-phosphate adenylyltransferase [Deltaproteobacteria bacterium]|nr:pantetheine-phosphate adenylyltransferase [Deltaproteobacteria bacterium]
MTKISAAVFPGSFDPFTNGHLDILTRSLKIFDRVILGVLHNPSKNTLFSVDERAVLIREVCQPFGERVEVQPFSGLLVDFVKKTNTRVILRGLRAISDYDYETQMALMNRHLNEEIETLFLVTSEQNSYVSSTLVKQVATLGGSISTLVPPSVEKALRKKLGART